jgi:hypothetical protein
MSTKDDAFKVVGGLMGMVMVLAMTEAIVSQQGGGSYSRVDSNPPGVGIQVFDADDTQQLLTPINWGNLSLGQTVNHDALIVNNDPSKTWNLTVTTSEWNPENATDYLVFSYDDFGQTLTTQMGVRFTLEVLESAPETEFSFTITLNFEELTP